MHVFWRAVAMSTYWIYRRTYHADMAKLKAVSASRRGDISIRWWQVWTVMGVGDDRSENGGENEQ